MLNNNEKNALIGFLVGYLILDWGSALILRKTNPKIITEILSNLNQKQYLGLLIIAIISSIIVYKELNKTSNEPFDVY
jgi:hypothetical protein